MTANDKPDSINIPAEALPDGALAQVTGGGSVFVQPYSKGDWVKLNGCSTDQEDFVGCCVTDVLGLGLYEITEFTYNANLCMIMYYRTDSYSSFEIASPAEPPSWAALAMEYFETHKGGAL